MSKPIRHRFLDAVIVTGAVAAAIGATYLFALPGHEAMAEDPKPAAVQAMPVSVATVEPRSVSRWDEFSGRLEAVERVDVRSRVAGAVLSAHFREGALVKQGDLLVTIDPAPYQAEVERAKAQVTAAEAQVSFTKSELERGQQLVDSRVVSVRDLDQRVNASRAAEASLRAAKAALQVNQLNLDYTQVRAPVTGRVGRLDVTVGNLVAAGAESPVLTTLVSINPIYASFNADEQIVARALASLGDEASVISNLDRIPVQITTATAANKPVRGKLQLIDNQVDARTGTVRMRATFDNADGRLMPGQFARVQLGQATEEPALVISERAVGTDQDKKFVMVIDGENKAAYREVKLGGVSDGLRIVTSGLKSGERIVVNGLQRVRPGSLVAPEAVQMDAHAAAGGAPAKAAVAQN